MSSAPGSHIAAVEAGYLELFRRSHSPRVSVVDAPDALEVHSDVAAPIFNGVVAPRLAEEGWQVRANELVDAHQERGLPFQWWTGPLSHDDRAEELLASRGLVSSGGAPGMYLDFGQADLPPGAPGLDVEVCSSAPSWSATLDTIVAGFGMPGELAAPFAEILAGFSAEDATTIHVLDGDTPVGGGTVAFIDGVAGLYNIAVVPEARRRGIGRAITLELLRIGELAGCHGAMLHASAMGYPVYEALGFEHVCNVHMRVWMPDAPTALAD